MTETTGSVPAILQQEAHNDVGTNNGADVINEVSMKDIAGI